MLAIDTRWYSFTPPQWSNIPPPLTDTDVFRDEFPEEPEHAAGPENRTQIGQERPEYDRKLTRDLHLR